jgi:hypothetical protein
MLEQLHIGHFGIEKTRQRARHALQSPGMENKYNCFIGIIRIILLLWVIIAIILSLLN